MRKTSKSTLCGVLGLALALGMFTSTTNAATILTGDLYFTTYRPQPVAPPNFNVHKISFVYANAPNSLTLSAITHLALLDGADGINFNPNNGNLLIGEQGGGDGAAPPGKVGQIKITGPLVNEVVAGVANTPYPASVQAYAIVPSPDKTYLLTFPNNSAPGYTQVNVNPLTGPNFLAGGVTHGMTGEVTITTAAYAADGTVYYGNSHDTDVKGFFGILGGVPASTTFTTSRVVIKDDVDPGSPAGQGALPTHALEYDPFTHCIIASSASLIWQLCKGTETTETWHIKSKINTAAGFGNVVNGIVQSQDASGGNWDQVTVDGAGHLFAANNNGNYLFVDYFASKLVGSPTFAQEGFLINTLDDFAGTIVVTPPTGQGGGTGCPATQGFWHKTANWPNLTTTIDGIVYNGATDHSMVIGGITYTQAQLAAIMPSGGLHTGGYVNALSQLIAAVLNLAAGAQTGTPDLINPAITAMNIALTGVTFVTGTPPHLVSLSSSVQATLAGFLNTLDTYNSSASTLGCVEGSGLTLGGGKGK